MANNNYPQITSVTSEALQAQIRNLLPSQEGFGTDLMAQNVIVPIIDLTSAAEGSTVPQFLQTALAFGSQTSFEVKNTTTTLVNNTGFWRVFGTLSMNLSFATTLRASIDVTDGLSSKSLYEAAGGYGVDNQAVLNLFDFIVFLGAGESISATTGTNYNIFNITVRQVADINGVLVNPSGFTPQ